MLNRDFLYTSVVHLFGDDPAFPKLHDAPALSQHVDQILNMLGINPFQERVEPPQPETFKGESGATYVFVDSPITEPALPVIHGVLNVTLDPPN